MDLLTQGMLGSTVAQACFSKNLGKKTALYGFVVGLLPDFDIVSSFWGEWASLEYHRGPTHALPILVLMSLPVGYFCKKFSKSNAPLSKWLQMAFLSLVTHPIIDWCTTYGTPLFWPFSSRRFANDSLSILDPTYSLPLLVVTLIGIFNLLTPGKRKALAAAALMITSLYAFMGYMNSQSLVAKGKTIFAQQGFKAVSVRATPTLFNNRLFRIVGKNEENDFMVTYMKTSSPDPITPIKRINSDKSQFALKALENKKGKLFNWFTMEMTCAQMNREPDGTTIVNLNDMRYGFISNLEQSLFSAQVTFDQTGKLSSFSREHGGAGLSMKQEIYRMTHELF